MSELKAEFQGFEELKKILKDLSKRRGKAVFVKAFNRSIEYLMPKLKETKAWKDNTGQLRGGLNKKTGTRNGAVRTGIEGNYYGRFLEFGWIQGKRPGSRAGRTARSKAGINFIPAKPWVRPVFQREKDKLIKMILEDLEKEVLDTVKRHNKGGRRR